MCLRETSLGGLFPGPVLFLVLVFSLELNRLSSKKKRKKNYKKNWAHVHIPKMWIARKLWRKNLKQRIVHVRWKDRELVLMLISYFKKVLNGPFNCFLSFKWILIKILSRIFFLSRVNEVLRSDTLLRVESCVILHVQSSSVLGHPTIYIYIYI